MKKQLHLTLFSLLLGVSANAGIVYVNSQATGSNNGSNWTNAYTEIQPAIASANSGDEIWVASGVYYPTADIIGNTSPTDPRTKVILIDKEITLYGGFSGSETLLSQRDWTTNETVFSGDIGITGSEIDNSLFVFRVTANAQIDGVSIKDAYQINAGLGSALQIFNTDFTIKNSLISDNFSTNGAGMLINQSTIPSSSVVVDNCHFYSNNAENKGAGIDMSNGNILITNCIFDSNTAGYGTSIVLQQGSTINEKSKIVNCLFTNNHSYTYGGMSVFSYSRPAGVEIVNCTMTNNTCDATDPTLAGSIRSNNVNFTVQNTILWDNNPFQESGGDLTKFTVDNSIIYGGFTGNNNLSTDPLFSNVTNNDFTLQATSGAIDAGDTTGFSNIIPLTDLNGNSRYFNGIDIGAYELSSTPCTVNIPDANFKAYLIGNTAINTNSDNEIQCSEASSFTGTISCFNLNISDMTGIEAFTAITALYCHTNSISSLDLSNNLALEELGCSSNALTSLDLSSNSSLIYLDASTNTLAELNVANGNNTNLPNISFNAQYNPNLTCIEVDDATYSSTTWALIDSQTSFSENCNASSSINEISNNLITVYPNPTNGLIYFESSIDQVNVYELNGKLLQTEQNINRIDLNHLSQGTYLIQMNSSSYNQTERVIIK